MSGTTRLLDYKLQPIFDHIRKSNINNLHQLQTLHHPPQPHHNTTLPIFYPLTHTPHPLNSLQLKPSPPKINITNKKQTTLSPKHSNPQKVFFIKTTSKIKKHLIEAIDYQGIQHALFKPQSKRTVYQQFYQTIVKKDRWAKRTNPVLFKTVSVDAKNSSDQRADDVQLLGRRGMLRAAAKKISNRCVERHRKSKLQSG